MTEAHEVFLDLATSAAPQVGTGGADAAAAAGRWSALAAAARTAEEAPYPDRG